MTKRASIENIYEGFIQKHRSFKNKYAQNIYCS